MHFRHQRLIFTATGHSHIDKRSCIMLEMECQRQDAVFINYTVEGILSFTYLVIRATHWLTELCKVFLFPSDHFHDQWAAFSVAEPSLSIWTDRISCYTRVNKHHAGECSSLSFTSAHILTIRQVISFCFFFLRENTSCDCVLLPDSASR